MSRYRKKKDITTKALCLLLVILMIAPSFSSVLTAIMEETHETQYTYDTTNDTIATEITTTTESELTFVDSTEPHIIINNNQPLFSEEDKSRTDAFETYSELDHLGRCGIAYANLCQELMPTEERTSIGHIRPSGWHTVKYNDWIDGNYLYNRCHLIGFQLAGENDNEKNLITGTRYMNVTGMLDFENQVADYIKNTGNHVLYRVTPDFQDDNLVASGVYIEAYSVEDNGQGICFYVYCPNIQPYITIDYATGDSWLTNEPTD